MFLVNEADFLEHHGIIGMKWGVRHGPPYPLGSDVSTGNKIKKQKNIKLTSRQKEALKSVARIGMTAVATYAIYKSGTIKPATISAGKKVALKAMRGNPNIQAIRNNSQIYRDMDFQMKRAKQVTDGAKLSPTNIAGNISFSPERRGLSINKINRNFVANLNERGPSVNGRDINCTHTTMGYLYGRLTGNYSVQAKPFLGIDESSGLIATGRNTDIYHAAFDNINKISNRTNAGKRSSYKMGAKEFLNTLPNNSFGALSLRMPFGGHAVAFEKDARGRITMVDGQKNIIGRVTDQALTRLSQAGLINIDNAYDFTNATINERGKQFLADYILDGI